MRSPDAHLLPSPRLIYYNPKLDPSLIANKMTPKMAKAVESGTYDGDGDENAGGKLQEPAFVYPYNLISSLCEDGLHRPALDVDLPSEIWTPMIGEAFPGHEPVGVRSSNFWHVYMPSVSYEEAEYFELLDHLVSLGLLELNYVRASIGREQTLLRPPHIKKLFPRDEVLTLEFVAA